VFHTCSEPTPLASCLRNPPLRTSKAPVRAPPTLFLSLVGPSLHCASCPICAASDTGERKQCFPPSFLPGPPHRRLFLALESKESSLFSYLIVAFLLSSCSQGRCRRCTMGAPGATPGACPSHSWRASASWEHSSPNAARLLAPMLAPALLGRWAPAASCLATPFLAAMLRPGLGPGVSPVALSRPQGATALAATALVLSSNLAAPRPKPGCLVCSRLQVSAPRNPLAPCYRVLVPCSSLLEPCDFSAPSVTIRVTVTVTVTVTRSASTSQGQSQTIKVTATVTVTVPVTDTSTATFCFSPACFLFCVAVTVKESPSQIQNDSHTSSHKHGHVLLFTRLLHVLCVRCVCLCCNGSFSTVPAAEPVEELPGLRLQDGEGVVGDAVSVGLCDQDRSALPRLGGQPDQVFRVQHGRQQPDHSLPGRAQ